MKNVKSLIPLLLCAYLLGGCVSHSVPISVERIVVFGDSNADTGRLAGFIGNQTAIKNAWNGRNSNGPLITEYRAEDLNISLMSFAVGGATSGDSNIVGKLFPNMKHAEFTGLLKQISEFNLSNEKFNANDLIIIWAGSNDIFQVDRANPKELELKISTATSNIKHALGLIYDLEGRNVVVSTRTTRPALGSDDDLNGRDLNRELIRGLKKYRTPIDLNIWLFDSHASITDMMLYPGYYGFSKDVEALYIDIPSCVAERFEDGLSVANTYINWDYPHKTTRVHRLLATQLLKTISKPNLKSGTRITTKFNNNKG